MNVPVSSWPVISSKEGCSFELATGNWQLKNFSANDAKRHEGLGPCVTARRVEDNRELTGSDRDNRQIELIAVTC